MKEIRRYVLFFLLLLTISGSVGCGKASEKDSDYQIYYLNKESTKIVSEPYELTAKAEDTKAVIDELLLQLSTDTDDVERIKPIPTGVEVVRYEFEETLLTIYFNDAYSSMDRISEALTRAAIVRTLMQAEGVECLTFYVGDVPLADRNGNPVGIMTNESFIENPGEQINSIQEANLVLYFANQEGNGLVQETKDVHYSSNISMEKLVMENLLEGPVGKEVQYAIPEGTKLMNVSVADGVCFVSLDENFLKQNYNIDEPIVIYSIVNSLSELATINKVQISVNGDTGGVYRTDFPLDEFYERNLDYVVK